MKKLITYVALSTLAISSFSQAALTCPKPSELIINEDMTASFDPLYPYRNNWYVSNNYIFPGTQELRFSKAFWANFSYNTHVTCIYGSSDGSYSSILSMTYVYKNKEPVNGRWKTKMDLNEFYSLECRDSDVNNCPFYQE